MRLPRFPIFSLFTANLGLILLSLPCLSSSHALSLDKAVPGRSEGGNSCDLTLLSRLPASGPSHSPSSQSLGNAKKDQLGSFISGMKWSHRAWLFPSGEFKQSSPCVRGPRSLADRFSRPVWQRLSWIFIYHYRACALGSCCWSCFSKCQLKEFPPRLIITPQVAGVYTWRLSV